MLEKRKENEVRFHDKLRGKALKKDKEAYDRLTSNLKFYSITRKSRNFVRQWVLARCQGKRVLDYCCGNGDFSIFLAKHGAKVVGIDISEISIQNAKNLADRFYTF